MKFGRLFEAALKGEDYPKHWVETAISYKQLKKCIKNVQKELSDLGFGPEMVERLWNGSFDNATSPSGPLQYVIAGDRTDFNPRLIFSVGTAGGSSLDATLDPETKAFLQSCRIPYEVSRADQSQHGIPKCIQTESLGRDDVLTSERDGSSGSLLPAMSIEVPLTSDSTFFKMLTVDVAGLQALRSKEEAELNNAITMLGQEISRAVEPSKQRGKTDLQPWREIFRLYIESNIFFSTNELDNFTRSSTVAQKQLQAYITTLKDLGFAKKLKRTGSLLALERFVNINLVLLRNLKFQELNITAMSKILKKFDKRTALGARQAFPIVSSEDSFSSSALAKAVCSEISEKVVAIIPQLNDYLCPVCFSVAWKPIRLKCNHIFCVRCMLVMQRARNGHCPLCRECVIMQADSANIDIALMALLIKYFPAEVKTKQRENEHNAAIDQFGKDRSCHVM